MTGERSTPADATAVPPLIVVAGATATGKTGLAISLAEAVIASGRPAEVISADSRQVYRGLDIGTAKATPTERRGIVHHGLDLVDPPERFTTGDFVRHVAGVLPGLAERAGIAILAGGTGLYLRAVARGLDTDALPDDPALRAELEATLAQEGLEPLVARLREVAPERAARVDTRNHRRVIRALELALLTGDGPPPALRGYGAPILWLGLRAPDDPTHDRWIGERARAQFDAGLVEEARGLRERWDPTLPCFSAIGYRESWSLLDGELTREAAITLDAQRNRAFARRQRIWFRAEPGIEWLDASDRPFERALERVRAWEGVRARD